MNDVASFAMVIGLTALALLAAVGSSRITAIIRVPAPALFLVAAAVAADIWPQLSTVPVLTDERLVTVALIFILFDGGMHIGWRRFRASAGSIAWLGLVGTALTALGVALAAHVLFGVAWPPHCSSAQPWRPPIRRWCSPCSVTGRSRAGRAPSWRVSRGRTTRWVLP